MSQWRTKAFYLTRNRAVLAKVALCILGSCMIIAWAQHAIQERGLGRGNDDDQAGGTAFPEVHTPSRSYLEEYRLLRLTTARDTARLWRWMDRLPIVWEVLADSDRRPEFEPAGLALGDMDLAGLIHQHTADPVQQAAFTAYVRHTLSKDDTERKTALLELEKLALAEKVPPYVNALLAEVMEAENRKADRLQALRREARHEGAAEARREAFDLALALKDRDTLRELCRNPAVLRDAEIWDVREAARLLRDGWLRLRVEGRIWWERWVHSVMLPVALLTAGIWYIILVYTGSQERWRWLRYLPAVFTGIASVALLLWAQDVLQYQMPDEGEPAATKTHEMLNWTLYVGLPEELVKMLCFSIFLPVLLHRGSAVKAALTGGCVGLGFALDENLLYMARQGTDVALERLLTANFLHIGLTGIVGWSVYELFRSKFHKTTEFLLAFLGAVVAHGMYNYASTIEFSDYGEDIMNIVIVAGVAHFYLKLLHDDGQKPAGWVISRTAIFGWGLALLIGLLMIVMTSTTGSLKGISLTLESALSMAILAYMYVRQFREV